MAERTDARAAVGCPILRPLGDRRDATCLPRKREPPVRDRAPRPGRVRAPGIELAEDDVVFLRSLSRPARIGQPRTLGS
ncbi:MAG TPA: hypothetical protein VNS09_16140 [Solirubrobacter sp.]|nr:hypothetical protein [Solirubrobacter sp.]